MLQDTPTYTVSDMDEKFLFSEGVNDIEKGDKGI